jgi:hypothetical protein
MLQPIGLSNGEVFRYCGTFSLDRWVGGHLSHDPLKRALSALGTECFPGGFA